MGRVERSFRPEKHFDNGHADSPLTGVLSLKKGIFGYETFGSGG